MKKLAILSLLLIVLNGTSRSIAAEKTETGNPARLILNTLETTKDYGVYSASKMSGLKTTVDAVDFRQTDSNDLSEFFSEQTLEIMALPTPEQWIAFAEQSLFVPETMVLEYLNEVAGLFTYRLLVDFEAGLIPTDTDDSPFYKPDYEKSPAEKAAEFDRYRNVEILDRYSHLREIETRIDFDHKYFNGFTTEELMAMAAVHYDAVDHYIGSVSAAATGSLAGAAGGAAAGSLTPLGPVGGAAAGGVGNGIKTWVQYQIDNLPRLFGKDDDDDGDKIFLPPFDYPELSTADTLTLFILHNAVIEELRQWGDAIQVTLSIQHDRLDEPGIAQRLSDLVNSNQLQDGGVARVLYLLGY